MLKKISLTLLIILILIAGVITPKLIILLDLAEIVSGKMILEGTIETGDHLTFKHRVDNSDQLLQEVDVLYYNKKLLEVEFHIMDKILLSIPTVYDGYISMTPEKTKELSFKEKYLYLNYFISQTTRIDDDIKIELNQEALDELSYKLTGKNFKESLISSTKDKMGSNLLSDKINFDVMSGDILFSPKGDITILLDIDEIHITARYIEGQRLTYIDRPMIKHSEIKMLMERVGKLIK